MRARTHCLVCSCTPSLVRTVVTVRLSVRIWRISKWMAVGLMILGSLNMGQVDVVRCWLNQPSPNSFETSWCSWVSGEYYRMLKTSGKMKERSWSYAEGYTGWLLSSLPVALARCGVLIAILMEWLKWMAAIKCHQGRRGFWLIHSLVQMKSFEIALRRGSILSPRCSLGLRFPRIVPPSTSLL